MTLAQSHFALVAMVFAGLAFAVGKEVYSSLTESVAVAYSPRQVLENAYSKRLPRARQRGFFASGFPSTGGVRLSVRLAARLATRFQHPAHPHCLKTMAVASESQQGASAMATLAHGARPRTPSENIQSIIRDALRAAATADTYQSALDATGAALIAISALVRAEVRHG